MYFPAPDRGQVVERHTWQGRGAAGFNPEGIVSTSPGLARSAYPGKKRPNVTTPTGLRRGHGRERRNPVGVETISRALTQGSAYRATRGWRTESRWDSGWGIAPRWVLPGVADRNPEGIVSTSPGLSRSAYPGNKRSNATTPMGLRRGHRREGRNPVGVETLLRALTQGSACRATLDWRTESRWNSGRGSDWHRQEMTPRHHPSHRVYMRRRSPNCNGSQRVHFRM